MESNIKRKNEHLWFKCYKKMIKATKPNVKFHYVGEHFKDGSLILSNHESTKGPLSWDFFCDRPVRFLGSEEMNSGLIRMYKYQSRVYYHEKKHWNLFLARLFCLAATPLTNLFYKGLDLISIREGVLFKKTMRDSYIALANYHENLVIFPEDSTNGYLKRLEGFHKGFILICEYCLKNAYDVPLAVSYYNKDKNLIVVGESIKYSEIKNKFKAKEDICEYLKNMCNELGDLSDKL